MRLSMLEPRVMLRHTVLSVGFVLLFLLLNRPEVIVISHLGAVVSVSGHRTDAGAHVSNQSVVCVSGLFCGWHFGISDL